MTASSQAIRALPERRRARLLGALRIAMAATCMIALISRYNWGTGAITFEPGNFFAYLTIQSNIVFAGVIAAHGLLALRGRLASARMETVRAGVIICTITAGAVFALLVQQSAQRAIRIDVPWSDVVLHFVLPVFALLDWIVTPRARPIQWRVIIFVLGYTCGWGAVTMIRGGITGWYPYYFLDPNQTNGIGEFLLLSAIALAVFSLVGALIVGISVVRARAHVRRRGQGSAARLPALLRHPVAR